MGRGVRGGAVVIRAVELRGDEDGDRRRWYCDCAACEYPAQQRGLGYSTRQGARDAHADALKRAAEVSS